MIEFKREVYRQALLELHRYLASDRRGARARDAADDTGDAPAATDA